MLIGDTIIMIFRILKVYSQWLMDSNILIKLSVIGLMIL